MRRITVLTAVIVVVMAFGGPRLRAAETENPKGEKAQKAKQDECSCSMCKMAKADGKRSGDADMKAMMKKMNMSPEMMKRCRMMMTMKENPADPNAILALKKDLDLSSDQVELLEDIAQQSRDKALLVLNDDQRAQVKKIPREPTTMKAMHEKMKPMMQKMMQKKKPQDNGAEKAELKALKAGMAEMRQDMKKMKAKMETMHKHMKPMMQKMKEGDK